MYLADAAVAVNGVLAGENLSFKAVSTDTRTLQPGDFFVALKGPHFNGHDYIAQAEKAGACALLVSESVDSSLPHIKVANTLRALGDLGAAWKKQFNPATVAITGSCGKTSVKEMVAAILSLRGKTLATKGNYNNEIGVPLTLLSLQSDHEYAVIELGANHIGEIAYTVSLVEPEVAVITNAGSAHIEGFGSRDNVARAKGEIYQGLPESGKALINQDDNYCEYWQSITQNYQQLGFSLQSEQADYFASGIKVNHAGQYGFTLHLQNEAPLFVQLGLLGKHNVMNAVTAASVAHVMGASHEQIKQGLQTVKAIPGRLYPISIGEQVVIDDTYNANPVSIKAAVDLLAELNVRTCVVLGDMAELGTHAPSMHREVGEYVATKGIDYLVVKGKHAADYLVGFSQCQNENQKGARFDEYEEVVAFLQHEKPDTLLVKGSRSAAMENVVQLLSEPAKKNKGIH